ncbi:hypothetical protein GCM10011614_33680 [Novosphingobium colocasiae]|uniref:LysR substrate-binding domain-containing protein n=2 Tax=Novosphingobium colocasiae TaxID=1256513 RepID=A0A918PN24_9SPHN|nr:hypothetical protein GCM10011614_33680 [Novosphingobium colocasiae]
MPRFAGSNEILKDLRNGQLDLGVVRLPVPESSPVTVELTERGELVLAMGPEHPLPRRLTIALAELADQPFNPLTLFNPVSILNPIFHLARRNADFAPRAE